METKIKLGVLLGILLIITLMPFSYARYEKDGGGAGSGSGGFVEEAPEPLIEPYNLPREISLSQGSKTKCDISIRTCRVTLVNLYRPFYMDGETYYLKKIYNQDIIEIYDKDKELLLIKRFYIIDYDTSRVAFIDLLGIEYYIEDRKYSADRIHLKKIQNRIEQENGYKGYIK